MRRFHCLVSVLLMAFVVALYVVVKMRGRVFWVGLGLGSPSLWLVSWVWVMNVADCVFDKLVWVFSFREV